MKTEQYALPFSLARLSLNSETLCSDHLERVGASKRINAVIEIEGSYKDVQQFFQSLPGRIKIKSCNTNITF